MVKVTEDQGEIDAMHHKVMEGAIYGFVLSTGLAIGGSLVALKMSEKYRNLAAPLKATLIAMPICAGVTIGAEEALLKYERDHHAEYDGFKKSEDEHKKTVGQVRQAVNWKAALADYRYHLVAAAWCAGVAGTLAFSYGNPYLTATQKAFHARVYSQGITVTACLLTAAVAPFATNTAQVVRDQNNELFMRRLAYEEKKYKETHQAA